MGPAGRDRPRHRLPAGDRVVGRDPAPGRARINLRVPPGMDARAAQDALVAHLEAVAPWNVRVRCEREAAGAAFTGRSPGPRSTRCPRRCASVYGARVTMQGQGGSIPLCNVFQHTFPDAEIMLIGVEEPLCLIHAPNESVDPSEIENMALVEAAFLQDYGARKSAGAPRTPGCRRPRDTRAGTCSASAAARMPAATRRDRPTASWRQALDGDDVQAECWMRASTSCICSSSTAPVITVSAGTFVTFISVKASRACSERRR